MSVFDIFTEEEKHKAELMSGKTWNELSDLAKLSFGMVARKYLSPEGIANAILYGEDESKWPEKK